MSAEVSSAIPSLRSLALWGVADPMGRGAPAGMVVPPYEWRASVHRFDLGPREPFLRGRSVGWGVCTNGSGRGGGEKLAEGGAEAPAGGPAQEKQRGAR